MSADLVIRGGTVVDGTGSPGVRADVAITDGRVSAIGTGLDGERTLDAGDHVVAPGFIDIHTHYDAQVFWDPAITPSCYHGVTTVVAGNCGFSIAPTRPEHRDLIARTLENVEDMNVKSLAAGIPWDFATFPEYLASVERRGTGLNFAAYIGHTALRLFAMGDAAYERTATPDEVTAMQTILREAVLAGAAGLATSFAITHRGVDGKPVPSRYADPSEFVALLEVMGELRRGVVAIAPGEQCGIDDMYRLQPTTGIPFTYGALLTSPAGTHKRLVDLNHEGWAHGAQVWPQVTPRPLAFAYTVAEPFPLNVNPFFAALMGRSLEERRAAYADPAWRRQVLNEWTEHPGFSVPRWSTYQVSESAQRPDLIGLPFEQVAEARGENPFDTMLNLALDERDLMPIERAVRKLTGVQADILGLTDRGYLRPGGWADVVVFDPVSVAPGPIRRVRDFPANAERLTADQPTGVRHVLVNGTPVQVDGSRVEGDVRPGQIVRPPVRP
jgi:N-acyl-D-amino-acid deacylase